MRVADVVDGERVDTGERLVQQHEGRPGRQSPRDFNPAPFAAREGACAGDGPEPRDAELVERNGRSG